MRPLSHAGFRTSFDGNSAEKGSRDAFPGRHRTDSGGEAFSVRVLHACKICNPGDARDGPKDRLVRAAGLDPAAVVGYAVALGPRPGLVAGSRGAARVISLMGVPWPMCCCAGAAASEFVQTGGGGKRKHPCQSRRQVQVEDHASHSMARFPRLVCPMAVNVSRLCNRRETLLVLSTLSSS